MNARAYFTILRPGRTLLAAGFYGGFSCLAMLSLHVRSWEALFFTFAVVGPVLVGSLLLGPVHEVMHRSFFPTLPGGRRALRRWHMRAVASAALLLFVALASFRTGVPSASLAGLIVAGLTLPMLNSRRRLWGSPVRPMLPAVILAGVALTIWGRAGLVSLCREAPWAVLIGGAGFAWVGFWFGFSDRQVRDRWRDPMLFCFQSILPFLGTDIQSYAAGRAQEMAGARSRAGGRDWNLANVGYSLSDWVRVVHHARYGASRRWRQDFAAALAGAVQMPVFIVTMGFLATFGGHSLSWRQFCQQVVELGRLEGAGADSAARLLLLMVPMMTWFTIATNCLIATVPACTFPISRDRLAACLFVDAHRLLALSFVAYLATTVLCYVAVGLVAAHSLDVASLRGPLAAAWIIPMFATHALGFFLSTRHVAWRVLYVVLVLIGFAVCEMFILNSFARFLLSPAGLALGVTVTALAVWASWRAFRRFYRHADLTRAHLVMKSLGFTAA